MQMKSGNKFQVEGFSLRPDHKSLAPRDQQTRCHGEEVILVYSNLNLFLGLEHCREELHPLNSSEKTYFILQKTNPGDKKNNI